MTGKCWSYCLAFTLLAWSSLVLAISPSKTQLEVIYVDMPPFTYQDENGKASGILIEKTAKALSKIEQPFIFRKVDLEHLAQQSRSDELGLVHLIGAFPVPKKSVSFGSRPLSYLRLHAYYINAKAIRTRSDLRAKEVILVKGYSYGYLRDYLNIPENRVRLIMADDHRHALELLRAAPGRYLLNYQRPFKAAVGRQGLIDLQHYALSEIPIYWAAGKVFAKKLPLLEAQLP